MLIDKLYDDTTLSLSVQGFAGHYRHRQTKQNRKSEKQREENKLSVVLKRGRCSSGYPPAEGRVEHSQRNISQENYIIFSLETKKRVTEQERVKTEEGREKEGKEAG